MSRILKLPPVVVLFAIAVVGTLFGIAGVILAVPAAAVLRVLVDELWVGRMDERGEDPHGPRREDEGDPMASIRRALGALRSLRRTGGGARTRERTQRGGARVRLVGGGSLLAGRTG